MLPSVQNPRRECNQGHERDVRKHPTREHHCGIKARPALLQAARHGPHQPRGTDHADKASGQQRPDQHGRNAVHQYVGGIKTLSLFGRSEHGHKGLAKSPFSKQTPK